MPRPSSIDQLPANVRDALNGWLRDPATTQLEAVDRANMLLEELGITERLSKSAVNRYAVRMDAVGLKLRQSREIAQMWIDRLGAQPQGQMGHLINEMLRNLAFDLVLKIQDSPLDEESMPGVIDMVKELALTATRLEKASSENVKREKLIREDAKREAAEVAEKVAKQGGLSADSVQQLRRAILGVRE